MQFLDNIILLSVISHIFRDEYKYLFIFIGIKIKFSKYQSN